MNTEKIFSLSLFFFFFLEGNYFTMLCWLLLYKNFKKNLKIKKKRKKTELKDTITEMKNTLEKLASYYMIQIE